MTKVRGYSDRLKFLRQKKKRLLAEIRAIRSQKKGKKVKT